MDHLSGGGSPLFSGTGLGNLGRSLPEALPHLLDDRTHPDFRTVYGALVRESEQVDVAIRKIRLSGVTLGREELAAPSRLRLILAEINVLTIASEAEGMAARRTERSRLGLICELLTSGVLQVKSAPLAGWAPDFSLFHGSARPLTLLMGLHWFQRPYPHRGPALASVHEGPEVTRVARRFNGIWREAHDVHVPLLKTLRRALDRVPGPP